MDDTFIDMMNAMMKHKHGSKRVQKVLRKKSNSICLRNIRRSRSLMNLFQESKKVLDKDGKVNALNLHTTDRS